MSKYVLLKNDGQVEMKELESALDLKTMYKWIDCYCIDIAESVISAKMGCKVMLIFDDEFLLNHNAPQANKIASLLFGYTVTTDECLCGNVIVAKEVEDDEGEPYFTAFDDEEIKKLNALIDVCKGYSMFIKFKVQEPRMMFIPDL